MINYISICFLVAKSHSLTLAIHFLITMIYSMIFVGPSAANCSVEVL